MASIAETVLALAFARLTATPFPGVLAANVRRVHRTPVDREHAPAVHHVDGANTPRRETGKNGCSIARVVHWTVSIYTRGDADSHTQADTIALEVMARLAPEAGVWPIAGVVIEPMDITHDTDIADTDATRMDLEFVARFKTPEWELDTLA